MKNVLDNNDEYEGKKDNEDFLLYMNENKEKLDSINQLEKNKEIISISREENLCPKIEPRIICFSRRRKCPKNIGDLTGYIVTLTFFIFFSILMTICLIFSKQIPNISDSVQNLFTFFIFLIWITSIISSVCLTDAASADPGRQRGYPIPRYKFENNYILKFVGGQKFTLKYCKTCNLIRDIRTFHCNTCGLCIEKHDHHCSYLSNCVGVYNYRKFFCFVCMASFHVITMFVICCHLLISFHNFDNFGYEWILFLNVLIMIFAGFFSIFVIWLLFQHVITIIQNKTTREFIKKKEYGIYNKGCKDNCKEALCSNSIREM